MKEIKLTQGQYAIVDDDDFERVSKYKWCAKRNDRIKRIEFYATHAFIIDNRVKNVSLHQFVIGNTPNGYCIDHINGNTLDNRKENLRFVTRQQNSLNRKSHFNSSSKYRCISLFKRTGKYEVQINIKQNNTKLGYYWSEFIAANVADVASILYHKEFGTLNFPLSNTLRDKIQLLLNDFQQID